MKKLILIFIFLALFSCDESLEIKVEKEINNTDVPAVVMGMINKNGEIEFYSSVPSR